MHSDLLDTYSHLDSPIHRAPAGLKMLLTLGLIVALVKLPPRPVIFVAAALLLVAVAACSRIPWRFLLKRLLLLEPMALGVAVLMLFQTDGLRLFTQLAIRSTLCIFAVVLLGNTTPFSEMLRVMKRVRVPGLIITTLALMHRYLFVLREEVYRMRCARASRTFVRSRAGAWHSLASVVAHLFVRSTARAERIYAAMCARGWQ